MFRIIIKFFIWLFLHIFYLFPLDKKKIYFVAFSGSRYACNPKFLYEFMLKNENKNSYKYVWEFNDITKGKSIKTDSKIVKTLSIKAVFEQMTSKYLITNTELLWYIPIRKNQVFIQTWHGGGAYKRVGLALISNKLQRYITKINNNRISYFVSSCKKFSEVTSNAKQIGIEKFISTGMPRNSFFFEKHEELKQKVFSTIGLNNLEQKVVLYAPTFRGKISDLKNVKEQLFFTDDDFEQLINTLKDRFGGQWKVLYRAHNFENNSNKICADCVINVTEYDEMQELLYVSDVLITDYSSCMWDFALTQKPGFLYMPDLEDYKNERDFFTPPEKWAYPIAETKQQLINNILTYNEKSAIEKIKNHFDSYGSYENKDSCELVLKKAKIIN